MRQINDSWKQKPLYVDNAEALAAYKSKLLAAKSVDNQADRAKYDNRAVEDRYNANVARSFAKQENDEYTPIGIAKDMWNATGGTLIHTAKDILHTFQGRNAFGQKGYTNFGENGPSWNRRLGGITKDALNASVVYGLARNAVQHSVASGLSKASSAEAANLGENLAGIRSAYATQLAENDAQIGNHIFPTFEDVRHPEWNINNTGENGVMRFYHTNQLGNALPSKLSSMEEVTGNLMAGRRGAGSDQLLSQGLYATNSGPVSATYGQYANSTANIRGGYIPPSLSDIGSGIARAGGGPLTQAANKEAAQMWQDSLLNKPHTLDMTMAELNKPFFSKTYNDGTSAEFHPWTDRLHFLDNETYDWVRNPQNADKTIYDLINNAKTEEDALKIIRNWPHTLAFKPAEPSSVNFRWNVIPGASSGEMSNIAAADQSNPLFLNIFDTNKEGARASRFYPTFDLKQQFNDKAAAFEKFRKDFAKDDPDFMSMNPYFIQNNAAATTDRFVAPGQNYWDLPVAKTKNGALSVLDEFKTLDYGNIAGSPSEVHQFLNLYEKMFPRLTGENTIPDHIRGIIDDLRNFDKFSSGMTAEEKAKTSFDKLRALTQQLQVRGHITHDVSPKEQFFQALKEEGFNALPHPGGITVNGANPKHQAINFLRPESLPPSNYISGGNHYIESLMKQRYGILSDQAADVLPLRNSINSLNNLANLQADQAMAAIRKAQNNFTGRLASQAFIDAMNR